MKQVYFIKPIGMDGPVKIGTASYPTARLNSLAAWCPFPLEIAAMMGGPDDLERRFHHHFVEDHSHHEWFHWTTRMGATIEAIRAGTFDIDILPRDAGTITNLAKRLPLMGEDAFEYQPLYREYVEGMHERGARLGRHLPTISEFCKLGPRGRSGVLADLRDFLERHREGAA